VSNDDRYLGLLKNSLLNETYIENDVRFLYAFSMLETNQKIDLDVFRNIGSRLPDWLAGVKASRQEGGIWWHVHFKKADGETATIDLRNVCEFSHTMVGRKRLDNLQNCLAAIRQDNVPGDVIETGVWRGGACIMMRAVLKAYHITDRTVWCADSFEGLPKPDAEHYPEDTNDQHHTFTQLAVSLDQVKSNFMKYGLFDDQVNFLKGWFKDTLPSAPIGTLAVLRLDGDMYESTMQALDSLYDKVSLRGFVIVDDYGAVPGCQAAIKDFRVKRDISETVVNID